MGNFQITFLIFMFIFLEQWNVPQTVSLTEPILASSASSGWLKRALLWIAAMASGWSWRMACHANLNQRQQRECNFLNKETIQKLGGEDKAASILLWDDRIVEESVPPLFNFPQCETTAELDPQMNWG